MIERVSLRHVAAVCEAAGARPLGSWVAHVRHVCTDIYVHIYTSTYMYEKSPTKSLILSLSFAHTLTHTCVRMMVPGCSWVARVSHIYICIYIYIYVHIVIYIYTYI